jgi:hypothetical protein
MEKGLVIGIRTFLMKLLMKNHKLLTNFTALVRKRTLTRSSFQ